MAAALVPCKMYAPDGVLLAAGLARLDGAAGPVVGALDRPGSVVQRLLLGGLHGVTVQIADTAAQPARVNRVFYDSRLGRACALTVAA